MDNGGVTRIRDGDNNKNFKFQILDFKFTHHLPIVLSTIYPLLFSENKVLLSEVKEASTYYTAFLLK